MLTALKNSTAGSNVAIKILPFTPVSLSTDPLIAYGRIAVYGALAYVTWKKARKVSYGLMGAAGLSLLTSLSSEAVNSGIASKTALKMEVDPGYQMSTEMPVSPSATKATKSDFKLFDTAVA